MTLPYGCLWVNVDASRPLTDRVQHRVLRVIVLFQLLRYGHPWRVPFPSPDNLLIETACLSRPDG